jgi:hypothetical protein
MKRSKGSNKLKKAYSLLEVVVSLGVIGVIMTMLFSILILSLQITFRILARSSVREEIANVSGLLARDIRNADFLNECGGPSFQNSCELIVNGVKYKWSLCGERICKDEISDSGSTNVFTSSENIGFNEFILDIGFSDPGNKAKQNILITISASHKNENFNVKNVLRQTSVSTRNYGL